MYLLACSYLFRYGVTCYQSKKLVKELKSRMNETEMPDARIVMFRIIIVHGLLSSC